VLGQSADTQYPTPAGLEPSPRDPRSYTPKHLADKILQSKSALEGERKQVTVLFADVKGSMDLAGQVDAEEPLFGVDDTVMMGGVRAEVLARFFRSAALVVLGRLAEGEHEMRRALAAAQRDGSDGVFEGHHQALVLWAIQAGFPD